MKRFYVILVLAIALALASLTVQPVIWAFVLGVGIPGLVGFVLLIAATRAEASAERAAGPSGDTSTFIHVP